MVEVGRGMKYDLISFLVSLLFSEVESFRNRELSCYNKD